MGERKSSREQRPEVHADGEMTSASWKSKVETQKEMSNVL